MLNHQVKEALKKNWGERADALDCYSEVKFFDPLSSWCCYIFAMDKDEEMIQAIFYSEAIGCQTDTIMLNDLLNMFNENGDHPVIDKSYRPKHVIEILKRLNYDR